ncbi:MAG TPA: MFS transporter [Candidatus Thermoplasmatota archaeon]|nr:MFS transporter [Candidatus Thermoplasmatota archaeon]
MQFARGPTYAVQIASHLGLSAVGLFVPLHAKTLGASDVEVGFIVAAYGAAVFFAGWLSGRAADRLGAKRLVLRAGLLVAGLTSLLVAVATDPVSLGLARVAFGIGSGAFPAALIAYAYDQTRRPGRFAAWGSLGFALGNVVAGLLGDPREVFVAGGALLLAALAVSFLLPPRPEVRVQVPLFPREVIARNLPAYTAMTIRHTGAAAVWAVFPIHLALLGATHLEIGLLYAANGIFQFTFMHVSDRFASVPMVVGGLATSALTFLLLAAAADLPALFAIQVVLGLSWALLYVGTLKYVMERNVERATSTGLLQSAQSMSNVLGPLMGGVVAQAAGYTATMWVALAMSLVAIPIFVWERRVLARANQ